MNFPSILWICLMTTLPLCAAEKVHDLAFTPGTLWLDDNGVHINAHGGGILFHEGTYWWFGEHKVAGRRGNSAQVGVHCYSSTNLYHWKDEGIALAVSEERGHEIERGSVIERPKVVLNSKTGKFVMWFHLELKGQGYRAARTGVAVSDTVNGPYRYLESFRPNAGQWPTDYDPDATPSSSETDDEERPEPSEVYLKRDFAQGQMARDMTIFMDDDGKAYHIHASEENQTLHIAELTDDYLNFTGRYARVLPDARNEAPAICKWQGKYWMLTSGLTGWAPNPARSAVADSIWGPWKPLGNPCKGVNPANDLGPEKTFGGQSTFILPVQGKPGAFIAMFDEWRPRNPIDGRYYWLPLEFENDGLLVRFRDKWDLSVFTD